MAAFRIGSRSAFSTISRAHAQALYVIGDPFFFTHRTALLKPALKARLPTMHTARQYADAGGLMSYGIDIVDLFRRAAVYVDKVLRGAKPSELPIQQPEKFEFVINLKTARALGLKVPRILLARADMLID